VKDLGTSWKKEILSEAKNLVRSTGLKILHGGYPAPKTEILRGVHLEPKTEILHAVYPEPKTEILRFAQDDSPAKGSG
jgi:hypothetical protein